MNQSKLSSSLIEFISRTSAYLPADVIEVLNSKSRMEKKNSNADIAMHLILKNTQLARSGLRPVCQDTGYLTFYITLPSHVEPLMIRQSINEAVKACTETGILRQNSVDSLSGTNSGTNLGGGTPDIHFAFHQKDYMDIRLIQKGGGCENMSAQYSLPCRIQDQYFTRDLDGVRACILHSVNQAQGKGCGPGFLGVCIGGDRATGYHWAKKQLLRPIEDMNPMPELKKLEAEILELANSLKIGPLGFGGQFTLGSCKIGHRNRLPASYFVTIAYMCWAYRRRGIRMTAEGEITKWLYAPGGIESPVNIPNIEVPFGRETISLKTPVTKQAVKRLKIGNIVTIDGIVYTARDAVHQYLYKGNDLPLLKNSVLYHCGPVITRSKNRYQVLAAGPTTSIREEPYQADIIRRYGLRAVVGKGGMGSRTLKACMEVGCVYLHAIGGAAQIYAECVEEVLGVYLEQFGSPESVWVLKVKNFPAVVTMDAHGNSMHEHIQSNSDKLLKQILKSKINR